MLDIRNEQPEQPGETTLVELTADIVSAYVSHNTISPNQLPELIANVGSALKGQLPGAAQPEPEPQKPAVPIRRSVRPDEITCLECGKKFKSIRRHLSNAHGLERCWSRMSASSPMISGSVGKSRRSSRPSRIASSQRGARRPCSATSVV